VLRHDLSIHLTSTSTSDFRQKNHAVLACINKLKTRRNLLCCFRDHGEIANTTKAESESKHLIARSEKCLLYVTKEYLREPWAKAEIKAAVKKARHFSRDMLLVLKHSVVSEERLKDLHLQEFVANGGFPGPECDDTDTLLHEQAAWLFKDVELAPVPQMPDKMSGHYEALVYFFGYLNFVLDGHRQRMKDVVRSGEKVVFPMLIVVPKSCQAPRSVEIEGKIQACNDKFVINSSHHGGKKNRPYMIRVSKLVVNADTSDVIYFSLDIPTILQTLYETYKTGQAGLTADHLADMCNNFYFTLQSLLCHPDNKHCVDQYRLLLWRDNRVNLYDFLLPFVLKYAEEGDASSLACSPRDGRSYMLLGSSFKRLESGVDPTTVWSGSQPYAMRPVSPRGICLIIVCDTTPNSAADVKLLRQMFCEQLDFDVRKHHSNQMTSDQLDSLLCDVAQEDHSQYDAFVCYIASRGRLSTICPSIGKLVDKNSEQLRDKPKLFLLQTTDDGTTEDSVFDTDQTQVFSLCKNL